MSHSAKSLVTNTIAAINPVDATWIEAAINHHQRLTKPAGSLGQLEELGCTLCAVQNQLPPVIDKTHVVIFAADHGVTASQALGPFPREVTAQMVHNFLSGGAAINAIAEVTNAQVAVVDMGVDADLSAIDSNRFYAHKIANGTDDFTLGAAMSEEQLYDALAAGISMADVCYEAGSQAVALGEMGIGNTTIASAMTAAMLGLSAESVTGRGTGSDDNTLVRKVDVINKALQVNSVDANNGFDVMQKLGGYELAGLAGLSLGLARRRIAVIADGFISTAAVLAATRMCAAVEGYTICAHQSTEPGHQALLKALGKPPLLNLGLRLGEGTGACLSITLLKSAANVMSQINRYCVFNAYSG